MRPRFRHGQQVGRRTTLISFLSPEYFILSTRYFLLHSETLTLFEKMVVTAVGAEY